MGCGKSTVVNLDISFRSLTRVGGDDGGHRRDSSKRRQDCPGRPPRSPHPPGAADGAAAADPHVILKKAAYGAVVASGWRCVVPATVQRRMTTAEMTLIRTPVSLKVPA